MVRSSLRSFILLILLSLVLAACSSPEAVVPTAEVVSTETPAQATATPMPTAVPSPTIEVSPTAITLPEDLTVIPLVRGQVILRPFAVMVDNHPDAYPQSGLNRASIVIEALAEYGITRYLAIFPGNVTADERVLGPVRSARDYYVQWAMGFGAFYLHAGGSPTGLALAESSPAVINVDALRADSEANFFRIETATRFAPHNLYTTGKILRALGSTDTGYNRSDVGYQYALPMGVEQRGPASSFTYYFEYADQPVGWTYDPMSNNYLRTRFGKPAVDEVSQVQLATQNVVIIEVTEATIEGDDKGRIEQQIIGSGKGVFYHDGIREEITWQKNSAEAQLNFYGKDGKEVYFTAGQIWISAIPSLDHITE
ncbi:MAG: DUF3048 domain-containing protein [Chloroflexota bacterium]|jgi:hypothetical protein